MSDLISRKKVIDILEKEKSLRCGYDADIAIFSIEKRIRKLPTDYSVDGVVKELHENASRYTKKYVTPYGNNGYRDVKAISVNKAVEIVKHVGASDYVCEWKQTSTAKYKTSCGYKLEEYFDTNACYCKQCGKKIKVVE